MNVVVDREWVADHAAELTLVDVRDPWEYEGVGHLPGAVNVPFETFRGGGEVGALPGAEAFATLLGERGVGRGPLVAYDDTHGVFAARFVVTALLYGYEEVAMLAGDYTAWSRERAVSRDPVERAPVEHPPGTLRRDLLVDHDAVRAALDSPAVVVDTREPREFAAGHLPGAINLDWTTLVDPDDRGPHPPERLRSILADHGITPDRRVLLYCNTARRISHTYLLLRHLGYEDLAFYEGSLTEWEAVGGPLDTADPPGE
jgi:thiosulfate/3-mercaptopyruvate sulfurtransferase